MSLAWVAPLAVAYAVTLALATLFVLAGDTLIRAGMLPARDREGAGAALRWGQAYFLGLPAFLLLFVAAARATGSARAGLALALLALVGLVIGARLRGRNEPFPPGTLIVLAVAAALVLLFSVTNATCWLDWRIGRLFPYALTHFGSIHSGRYANYALFIVAHDRIPFLAQNIGQSLLASAGLLLGVRSSLAALMTWIPVSLAALALVVFGTLRARGLSGASAGLGTFFVLACNVALDHRHVLVLDNGSPLALIGYTDLIVAVGSLLLFVEWLERAERMPANSATSLTLPALLGCTWCWFAPQNLILAPAAWAVRGITRGPRRAALVALIFAASTFLGATQLGILVPAAWRENVGSLTVLPKTGPTFRPYLLYIVSQWSDPPPHWNVMKEFGPYVDAAEKPRLYETLHDRTRQSGAWPRAAVALALTHLAASLRIYFFPLLGLLAMGLAARRLRSRGDPLTATWRHRLWIATATFGVGFAISFGLEYGGRKWWLTRFLAGGIAVSLIGLYEALARELPGRVARHIALALLLLVAAYGPVRELLWEFRENFITRPTYTPLDVRLETLATAQGPFPDR